MENGGENSALEGLLQVGNDVLGVLQTNGQAHGVGVNALIALLGLVQLGMGGAGGMDDQALGVGHVGQQAEQLQPVNEGLGLFGAAFDADGEDGTGAVGEVGLVQALLLGIGAQGRMADALHLGHGLQVLQNLQGVLHMAVHTQGQGLQALQEDPAADGGQGSAGIAQQDGADAGDEGGGAGGLHKADAVVALVGLGQLGVLVRMGGPVKGAAVHDHTADGGAVAADELGGGLHHDVGAVLDGTDQVGGAEGVVDDQGQAVLVGDGGNAVNVGHFAVGVAQGLDVDGLGVGLNGLFKVLDVQRVHEGGGHAVVHQGVGQQVVGAAVDVLGGNDVVAAQGHVLDGVGDGRGAGSHAQGSHAALQSGHALLEDVLGGVGQAAVDVAGIPQGKAVSGVLAVAEHEGGRLINGNGPGVGGVIVIFLADVQLFGFKGPALDGFFRNACHNVPLSAANSGLVF